MQECPKCGYVDVPKNIPHKNAMNHYVTPTKDAQGKDVLKEAVFNDDVEQFTDGKGVNWTRKDKYIAPVAPVVKAPEPLKK